MDVCEAFSTEQTHDTDNTVEGTPDYAWFPVVGTTLSMFISMCLDSPFKPCIQCADVRKKGERDSTHGDDVGGVHDPAVPT